MRFLKTLYGTYHKYIILLKTKLTKNVYEIKAKVDYRCSNLANRFKEDKSRQSI